MAAANAYGLELEARASALPSLEVTARYTYTHTASADSGFDGATFAQGRRLIRRPTNAASLDLAYGFGARGSASVTAQYVGDRDDEDFSSFPTTRVTLPSYVRVDLAGEWALLERPRARGWRRPSRWRTCSTGITSRCSASRRAAARCSWG